jgi:hypothetical protein
MVAVTAYDSGLGAVGSTVDSDAAVWVATPTEDGFTPCAG